MSRRSNDSNHASAHCDKAHDDDPEHLPIDVLRGPAAGCANRSYFVLSSRPPVQTFNAKPHAFSAHYGTHTREREAKNI